MKNLICLLNISVVHILRSTDPDTKHDTETHVECSTISVDNGSN